MPAQQIEAPAQTGQHAKGQDIDLEQLQRIDVILVPFQHRPTFHRSALPTTAISVSRPRLMTKPPTCVAR